MAKKENVAVKEVANDKIEAQAANDATDQNITAKSGVIKNEELPELEPEAVKEDLSLEEQIEAWRVQANNFLLGDTGEVDQRRNRLWTKIATKLNELSSEWSMKNKTDGYTVAIERRNVNAAGFLTIRAASNAEGQGCINDINAAVANFCQNNEDSLIEVTSSLSTATKTARILASTVAGFALQTYDIFPEYKGKEELLPLDKLPRNHPANASNSGPMILNR